MFPSGNDFSWDDLAERFGVKSGYFAAAGGMISAKKANILIIITHPEGGRSFDYEDYWEGDELIYTGKGQSVDQKYTAQNRDLGENAHPVLVFQPAGPRRLRFLGEARCVEHWRQHAPDKHGIGRKVLRFRLRFDGAILPRSFGGFQATEGARLLRTHMRSERARDLVDAAKQHWKSNDPTLSCEVCGFSFSASYCERGNGHVKAHHRIPLSVLAKGGEVTTSVKDLAPVCSNCHRMLLRPPYPSKASCTLASAKPAKANPDYM